MMNEHIKSASDFKMGPEEINKIFEKAIGANDNEVLDLTGTPVGKLKIIRDFIINNAVGVLDPTLYLAQTTKLFLENLKLSFNAGKVIVEDSDMLTYFKHGLFTNDGDNALFRLLDRAGFIREEIEAVLVSREPVTQAEELCLRNSVIRLKKYYGDSD